MAKVKGKIKKGAGVIGAGAAGTVAGTYVGYSVGGPKGGRVGGHIGGGVGLAAGSAATAWNAKRPRATGLNKVPSVQESTGTKAFKRKVGTKTNGRVGKGDHPYM